MCQFAAEAYEVGGLGERAHVDEDAVPESQGTAPSFRVKGGGESVGIVVVGELSGFKIFSKRNDAEREGR